MEVIKLIETAKDNNSRLSEIDFKDRIDEKKVYPVQYQLTKTKVFKHLKDLEVPLQKHLVMF